MREEKVWGVRNTIIRLANVVVDELWIKKGGHSSYHYHQFKDNWFYVVYGKVLIEFKDELHPNFLLRHAEHNIIKAPLEHRFLAYKESRVIEVSFLPGNFNLDLDIIRNPEFPAGIVELK